MAAVTSCENTLYRMAFAPNQKPYWIGILFTHKKRDFGSISVTERSCARADLESAASYIG